MRDEGGRVESIVLRLLGIGGGVMFIYLVVLDFATPIQIDTHAMMLPLTVLFIALGDRINLIPGADPGSDSEELADLKRRYADGEMTLLEFESEAEAHFEREILDDPPESEPASEPMATGGVVGDSGTPEAVVPMREFQKGPNPVTAEEVNRYLRKEKSPVTAEEVNQRLRKANPSTDAED